MKEADLKGCSLCESSSRSLGTGRTEENRKIGFAQGFKWKEEKDGEPGISGVVKLSMVLLWGRGITVSKLVQTPRGVQCGSSKCDSGTVLARGW